MFGKIGEQRVEKVLGYTFLFLFLFMVVLIKILGSSNVPSLVEKDGYCKTAYGEDWNYNEKTNLCSNGKQLKGFGETEFREVCPENKLISTQFYSDCFHKGDSR